MIDHMYTLPVYTRTLQFAYMQRQDWADAANLGTRTWASEYCPRLNLGRATGKTTAAVNYAEQFSDTVIITRTEDQANNIAKRHPGVRTLGLRELDKLVPHHFTSTSPMFVFDDIRGTDVLDVLIKFRPTRFIHLGTWG